MDSSRPQNMGSGKVSQNAFVAVQWGGVGLSLGCLILRCYIRLKCFRRVFADDILCLVAWLIFLISSILWQTVMDDMFTYFALAARRLPEPTPVTGEMMERFLRMSIPCTLMFHTVLWLIKLSFLAFFRRLGQQVRGQRLLWWCVLGVVLASWVACIGTIGYRCRLVKYTEIVAECSKPSAVRFHRHMLRFGTVTDVLTDALIMLLPTIMLWKVRITLRQKLALTGVFSLTVFVMTAAIIRMSMFSEDLQQYELSWLYTWSVVEMTVALIISSAASYRALFTLHERNSRQLDFDLGPKDVREIGDGSRSDGQNFIKVQGGRSPFKTSISSIDSFLPPRSVHVRHEFAVHSGA